MVPVLYSSALIHRATCIAHEMSGRSLFGSPEPAAGLMTKDEGRRITARRAGRLPESGQFCTDGTLQSATDSLPKGNWSWQGGMTLPKNDEFKNYTRYAEHCLNLVAETTDRRIALPPTRHGGRMAKISRYKSATS